MIGATVKKQAPSLYRCLGCGALLRYKDVLEGKCLGHRIKFADHGSIFEWIKVKYWKITGQL